jgi:hypothetical protein
MSRNLDTLKSEILRSLDEDGFTVFYGEMRHVDRPVAWDTRQHQDFREFLKAASGAGVKLIVFHCQEFTRQQVEEAIEDLDIAQLSEEEFRGFGRRLKELREYEGFTCILELSFDLGGQTYLYHLHTDWFSEFLNIRSDIDDAFPDGDEDDESMGGYFSNN